MKKLIIFITLISCICLIVFKHKSFIIRNLPYINYNVKQIFKKKIILPTVEHESIPSELAQYIPEKGQVILIDYKQPSNKKRLWVVQDNRVVINCRVGHGKNSGWNLPTKFSNKNGSNKSCIGKFITDYEYNNPVIGRAMVVYGLEPGINDNAFKRGIRFHSSKYASDKYFENNGRIGRSLGCFTTDKKYNDQIIDICKFGTAVYVNG